MIPATEPGALLRSMRREMLVRFLWVMTGVTFLLGAVAGMHYITYSQAERLRVGTSESLNVALGKTAISNALENVASDLMYLVRHNEVRGVFALRSPEDASTLIEDFSTFIRQKGIYDQVRLLSSAGKEMLRVNFNDGDPVVVHGQQLQDKSDRYYFKQISALESGDIYISPMDLNVEYGHIEQPPKPMIRFGTPVLDGDGRKIGILVLNYLGERLLETFRTATANISDHVQLVNSDGYWLSSPNRQDEWGFMYGLDRTFGAEYPSAWKAILSQTTGQIETASGIFSFRTVDPVQAATRGIPLGARGTIKRSENGLFWKVIAHVPPGGLADTPGEFFRRHLALYGLMFVLLGVGSGLLSRATVRHRIAEAEVELEGRFRRILEDIELLAVGLDTHGSIMFCNDALLTLTGWRREALIGRNWTDTLIPVEGRDEGRQRLLRQLSESTSPTRHEGTILTRQGDRRIVTWSATRLYAANGRLLGLTWIGEDVTEARRAELQMRKLSTAVEQSPSTVMITNRQGRIEYVNPKFTALTGYSLDEVRGKNPRMLKSGDTPDSEYREMWGALADGNEWRGVFHNRKKNGELYWEAACITPIRNPAGEITHMLAVKEDITERVRLEQEVKAQNRELARNQALAAVGRMANMVAHDLRNPLSSVKMGLQILGKRDADQWRPEQKELHQIALEQVQYMEEILADLLSYSSSDAIVPEWLKLPELLDTAVLLAQKSIDESGAGVRADHQPGMPTVHGDPRKLRQAFSNLIVNAAQACEGVIDRRPVISVTTRLELEDNPPKIRVEVRDNGQGIHPAIRDKLFEPFFTTRSKGTGLGLAIVDRVIGQHHGMVRLDPNGEHGTCATVVLPTVPLQADKPNLAEAASVMLTGGDDP